MDTHLDEPPKKRGWAELGGKNLTTQLRFLITFILAAALVSSFYFISVFQERSAIEAMKRDASDILQLAQNMVTLLHDEHGLDQVYLQSYAESVAKLDWVEWIEVFDHDAKVVAHSNPGRIGSTPLPLHHSHVTRILKTGETIEEPLPKERRFVLFSPFYSMDGRSRIEGVIELVLNQAGERRDLPAYASTLSQMARASIERIESRRARSLRSLQEFAEGVGKLTDVKRLGIYDERATVIAHTSPERIGEKPRKTPLFDHAATVSKVMSTGEAEIETASDRGTYAIFAPYFSKPARLGEARKVAGVVQLEMNLDQVTYAAKRARGTLLVLGFALILALSLALQRFMAKLVVEPIRRLRDSLDGTRDGLIPAEVRNDSLNEIGDLTHSFNSMIRRLREAKEKEAALNALILSRAKMTALGEMSAGVAHEINNPLGIIRGKTLQLARKTQQGAIDPEHLRTELGKIEETSMRIAKIIEGLRDFSRNSVGDPMKKVQLARILADTLELCEARFREDEIRLQVDCAPELWVECRPVQISQVLMNLLNNSHDAIEALPERWITLKATADDRFVTLTVTDSGNGIPAETAEKVMQPFFTTKPVGKGTGLGLSISKGIIEAHQGELRYDSGSKNTCFVIRLPLAPSSLQGVAKRAADETVD